MNSINLSSLAIEKFITKDCVILHNCIALSFTVRKTHIMFLRKELKVDRLFVEARQAQALICLANPKVTSLTNH